MRLAIAVFAVLLCGCADVIGLSGLNFDRDLAGGGGGSGGEGGAEGGGGGGGAPPACEGQMLADFFEDGTVDDVWMQMAQSASIEETGGELVLTADSPNATASITSVDFYDIPLGWTSVKLADPGPAVDGVIATMSVFAGGTTYLVEKASSSLRFSRQVSLSTVEMWEGTYDDMAHRYVRIRATMDARLLEASADGEDWIELWAEPEGNLPEMLNAQIKLGFMYNDAPLEVRFDDLLVCGG